MQKIITFLWFDNQAEEAIQHYSSIFKNGRVVNELRQGGKLITATFELDGQQFIALNGGPNFKFSEAISLLVNCETQQEIDYFWEKLSDGGSKSQCGWLKDRFGLSWQVVPTALGRLVTDPDPKKSKAVWDALMKMSKIVIADLQKAGDSA